MSRARDLADGTFSGAFEADSPTFVVDAANNRVGIGTSSPAYKLQVNGGNATNNNDANTIVATGTNHVRLKVHTPTTGGFRASLVLSSDEAVTATGNEVSISTTGSDEMQFATAGTERARITSGGVLLVGQTTNALADTGHILDPLGLAYHIAAGNPGLNVNRKADDGNLVTFYQDGSLEGTISVSGTTVSYNGGHLSRWAQTADNTRIDLLKGTVMTNLDQMAVWSHDTTYWTEEDDLPEGVAVGDVKLEAFVEDNEQLNCMAVSSVEGDPNVAGVFVNWDNDDGGNDMNIAMTGDMIIRIAQGTTVQRGDLLMSAGDGTAKPQGDDIIRSKTIAKVTSTHVTCTYEDGSYCVPCVLMAC
jgi:membrane-bound inhibitor of C-type lysozyme